MAASRSARQVAGLVVECCIRSGRSISNGDARRTNRDRVVSNLDRGQRVAPRVLRLGACGEEAQSEFRRAVFLKMARALGFAAHQGGLGHAQQQGRGCARRPATADSISAMRQASTHSARVLVVPPGLDDVLERARHLAPTRRAGVAPGRLCAGRAPAAGADTSSRAGRGGRRHAGSLRRRGGRPSGPAPRSATCRRAAGASRAGREEQPRSPRPERPAQALGGLRGCSSRAVAPARLGRRERRERPRLSRRAPAGGDAWKPCRSPTSTSAASQKSTEVRTRFCSSRTLPEPGIVARAAPRPAP